MAHRAAVAAAVLAGTALRVTRPARRTALRAAPGVAGAVMLAVAAGELASHVWHRGLGPWVGLAVAGVFALWFGAEINARPPAPRQEQE